LIKKLTHTRTGALPNVELIHIVTEHAVKCTYRQNIIDPPLLTGVKQLRLIGSSVTLLYIRIYEINTGIWPEILCSLNHNTALLETEALRSTNLQNFFFYSQSPDHCSAHVLHHAVRNIQPTGKYYAQILTSLRE